MGFFDPRITEIEKGFNPFWMLGSFFGCIDGQVGVMDGIP